MREHRSIFKKNATSHLGVNCLLSISCRKFIKKKQKKKKKKKTEWKLLIPLKWVWNLQNVKNNVEDVEYTLNQHTN